MSERAAAADCLSTCYREVARAIRKIIPTLRYIKSREELESVAACYEKLAEHRDDDNCSIPHRPLQIRVWVTRLSKNVVNIDDPTFENSAAH